MHKLYKGKGKQETITLAPRKGRGEGGTELMENVNFFCTHKTSSCYFLSFSHIRAWKSSFLFAKVNTACKLEEI